ncbi:STAS-like domain-containing protein [Marinobacter salarius]|uniref:STAS-like domain-containing protein n=1 Tax=Marinobacter salarius TaxID=1420917 RepID=UPI000F854E0B|nr:STAS-like domain-containing protein [Marinobacter salarius]AZR42986.1 hypothetical protein MTMN5_03553 [Marinobacter salarius]
MKTIFVKNFSEFPGPRYRKLGTASGEEFRLEVLAPEIEKNGVENISIDLDGTCGYGSSFLEEAFGGLVREKVISPKQSKILVENLISEEDPSLIDEIKAYVSEACKEV